MAGRLAIAMLAGVAEVQFENSSRNNIVNILNKLMSLKYQPHLKYCFSWIILTLVIH